MALTGTNSVPSTSQRSSERHCSSRGYELAIRSVRLPSQLTTDTGDVNVALEDRCANQNCRNRTVLTN